MSRDFAIAGRAISGDTPPYIIAEMSANHGGSLARALRIIELAARVGADAIKFQAYTADSLTIDTDAPGFVIEGGKLWNGERLYSLYRRAATPYEWFPELFACARRHGITAFASPFDADAVAMLEGLGAPAYKIASFEAADLELIAACASTGKPLIISTGLCEREEIGEAVATAQRAGDGGVMLLRCVSAYPADPRDANLATILAMREAFGVPVGLSDHTIGTAAAVAACALGAVAIEKHFIDAPEPPTPDSAFSATPEGLGALVRDCRVAQLSRGAVSYGISQTERDSLVFRRSLYAVVDIAAAAPLTRENVRSIRPGYGLAPKHLPAILGRPARVEIRRGTPLRWDLIG